MGCLTGDQRTTLAGIARANGGLYWAYLLKEQLREIFACAIWLQHGRC